MRSRNGNEWKIFPWRLSAVRPVTRARDHFTAGSVWAQILIEERISGGRSCETRLDSGAMQARLTALAADPAIAQEAGRGEQLNKTAANTGITGTKNPPCAFRPMKVHALGEEREGHDCHPCLRKTECNIDAPVLDQCAAMPFRIVFAVTTKTWLTLVAIAASPATQPRAIRPTAIAYSVVLWPFPRASTDTAPENSLRMRSCIFVPPPSRMLRLRVNPARRHPEPQPQCSH